MQIVPVLVKEMESEAATTRKMLSIIPADKFDWRPHAKSMSLLQLSNHIAELPGWVALTLNTTELDFATFPYKPTTINNTADLLAEFDKNVAIGLDRLKKATEAELEESWTMRNGDIIYFTSSRLEALRVSAYCQTVHHRAQLGVFLRLLNVPIPGSYGPSADELGM